MADYLSIKDYEKLRGWIVAFLTQLPLKGGIIGISAADQAALISAGNAAIACIDSVVSAENAFDSAVADRLGVVDAFARAVRPIVRRAKTHTSYTKTIGEALGIVAESTPVDPASIKPVITLIAYIGYVRVRIQRRGAESVKLFCRRTGQTEWTPLARVIRSVFDDTSALTQPGVPEIKEYMAQAYIGDDPVGQPSDPKVVVFAGSIAA